MSEINLNVRCTTCLALCCRLEVRLIEEDDFKVPQHLTKKTDSLYTVMKLSSDGFCSALDSQTMRCTIYNIRPSICREYEAGDYDCLNERKKLKQTFRVGEGID